MTDNKGVPVDALVKIVEYMAHDECKHYEQMLDDGEDVSNHIYISVGLVADWLRTQGFPGAIGMRRQRPRLEAMLAAHGLSTVNDN